MGSLGLWGDDTANNARGGRSWGSEDQEEAVLPPTEQGPLLLWVDGLSFRAPVYLSKDFLQIQPGYERPTLAWRKSRAQAGDCSWKQDSQRQ